MPTPIVRTGGCLCEAVRYEIRGEPYVSGLCHCTICRKLAGSSFSATANWHQADFQFFGEVQTFERRQFCPTCGSRLFYLFEQGVEVFLGSLDAAPNDIVPTSEVWTVRREHWLSPVAESAQFDQNPPKA